MTTTLSILILIVGLLEFYNILDNESKERANGNTPVNPLTSHRISDAIKVKTLIEIEENELIS